MSTTDRRWNLTGVLALFGVAAGLTAIGYVKAPVGHSLPRKCRVFQSTPARPDRGPTPTSTTPTGPVGHRGSIPTLIVSGAQDGVVDQRLWQQEAAFTGSNILHRQVEGAGHFPWVENPEAIRAAFADLTARADAAKNESLSRMSHELHTPLNAVLGFAQLLELDALSPSRKTPSATSSAAATTYSP